VKLQFAVLLLLVNIISLGNTRFKYNKNLNKIYLINKINKNGDQCRYGDRKCERTNLHTFGNAGKPGDKRRQQDSFSADERLSCFEDPRPDELGRAYKTTQRRDGKVWLEGIRCAGHCSSIQKGAKKEKIRIVADTNVLISATFWPGDSDRIINLVNKGKIILLISPEIFNEYSKVLAYPEIIEKIKLKNLEAKLTPSKLLTIASVIYPCQKLDLIKADPDDNIIPECAHAGFADYIITQDKHILSLKEFENIPILTPADFLVIYKEWTGK
jgi:putative PIN family toxin of toxin-antitoxin system